VIRKSLSVLQTRGPAGLIRAVGRRFSSRRLKSYRAARRLVSGKTGLEIGGPSDLFAAGGPLPLYPLVTSLDNCNFSATTIWEGQIREGLTFRSDARRAPGRQYIAEAANLSAIASGSYDVVLSSHTIEHSANPLRALREWLRVLKDNGGVVLVVPHKEGTFDHRRPLTTLEHLIEDEKRETKEDDLTHLDEILALHDLALDPGAGDARAFAARSARNAENRCLHHHVFDTTLVAEMLHLLGLQIDAIERVPPYHIVAVARKTLPAR
jgi:SAM-dependent methyltransferase